MISALTLLLVAQEVAKPPKPTFEQILEAANKAWYELPAATTVFGMESAEGFQMREYRDGSNFIFQVDGQGQTQMQMRSNGVEELTVVPPRRQYAVGPATARPSWADRKLEPEKEVPTDEFQLLMSRERGLTIRVHGRTFRVTTNVPLKGESGEVETRYVSAEVKRPATDTVPEGSITFKATLDAKLGFIREATITVTDREKPGEPTKIVWRCEPKNHPAADYTIDLTKLEGWTKVNGQNR